MNFIFFTMHWNIICIFLSLEIPQFEDQLKICNWLVDHPDVIKLACQMLDMKNQATSSSLLSALAPSPLTSEGNLDEGNVSIWFQ